ncbi:saccharopine dehydrogenase family protein [Streptomyces avicenniae]|uniref:saccharopine dehydrogenase family protein n=1 Tax=Streptomyces avicenniae TaxID=500153 RepID=UPI00069C1DB5|nr:saccharopine dehydrogenase NADP-binding domain-containing protein [Streptomyces avicenniae]
MRIAVYGASGFTGGLVVGEVARRGFAPVLVGRDGARLRAVAAGEGAEVRVADLGDAAGLAAAFADCDAVVNCAGPFTLWGEPVVRAALAARTPYVDTTGEQGWIQRVHALFGDEAARAGVAVVPGMADDGGPGDLVAALTAARLDAVDDLLVADLRLPTGGASRGTARSMAAIAAEPGLEYADGAWRVAKGEPAPLVPPGETRAAPMRAFPLPGVATVPRHVTARRVHAAIRAEVAAMFASLTPEVLDSVPETVPEDVRRAGRWLMLAEATAPDGRRARGWAGGPDGYGLTAVIAVEAAHRLVTEPPGPGVLSPAQAFAPRPFLDALAPHGVTWRVEAA